MNKFSSQDRSSLVRLASSLPQGDGLRRAILSGLKKASTGQECEFFKAKDGNWYMGLSDYPPEDDREYWDGSIEEWYGPFPSFESAYKYLHDNFANPGGYRKNDGGTKPPPRNPTKPSQPHWSRFSASSLDESLAQFNRSWPFHRDLDAIDSNRDLGRRTLIGDGKFDIPGRRAGLLARAGMVDIVEGLFGKELHLTNRGLRSLTTSREAFSEL